MLTDIFQLIFKLMNAYEHWEVYKIQGVLETLPETKRIGKKKTYRQQFVNIDYYIHKLQRRKCLLCVKFNSK